MSESPDKETVGAAFLRRKASSVKKSQAVDLGAGSRILPDRICGKAVLWSKIPYKPDLWSTRFAILSTGDAMRPLERRATGEGDLSRLDQIIDVKHPLVRLGGRWIGASCKGAFSEVYTDEPGRRHYRHG